MSINIINVADSAMSRSEVYVKAMEKVGADG